MAKVNIYEAKTNLSKYIEMLEKGKEEEIIITRYDKKVARIILYKSSNKKKRLGAAKGIIEEKEFVTKDKAYGITDIFGS